MSDDSNERTTTFFHTFQPSYILYAPFTLDRPSLCSLYSFTYVRLCAQLFLFYIVNADAESQCLHLFDP